MESYRKVRTFEVGNFSYARILGTVIRTEKRGSKVLSFILDDGFGRVTCKVIGEDLPKIEVGEIVEVFGKVNEFNGKYEVLADKIFRRDIYYELVRLLEFGSIFSKKKTVKREDVENYIKNLLESKELFTLEDIPKDFPEDIVMEVIEEFKKDGIIFEEKPGRYRRL